MIHLRLNEDGSIHTALHESCGVPDWPHVNVEDVAWAAVSGYDHSRIRFVDGVLVVDPTHLRECLQVRLTAVLQTHLDAIARTRGYDGIVSLCSYASSNHPRFGPEGRAGLAWRDAVWAAGYQVVADVDAGRRTIPTAEQLLAEMPAMVWPES